MAGFVAAAAVDTAGDENLAWSHASCSGENGGGSMESISRENCSQPCLLSCLYMHKVYRLQSATISLMHMRRGLSDLISLMLMHHEHVHVACIALSYMTGHAELSLAPTFN